MIKCMKITAIRRLIYRLEVEKKLPEEYGRIVRKAITNYIGRK